ncbi:phage major capsid protein [Rhizobium rhizogenes]|uniref:Major capsid protein n=1 Tax=Rhizobium rhizogenes NBRC 13257 TaxID=1220581 RepID=A0AA87U219_RHIRH|nr:phage major capsid protein [Rhizobium rhizogenes]NTG67276.1 phage major capsid protein [Rhizobium rhizogenes]TRB14324.1 phage major capsid protein [Rhizobium rhizogenes]TRB47114.1 phage major capsid protein [Rhizobium rhizogenes]TRB64881.1 phage major capsid protein [Rhizobium rhizogenes]GAJ91031.1 putative major capsid protein [Rhizobium rhizogenes NBRC 13257]
MSLNELQEKRGRLVTQAREALDEITKNTDDARSAELDKRHDDIMADFDRVEKQIEREERTAALEKRFEDRAAEERAKRRPVGSEENQRGQDIGDQLSYRHVFHKYLAAGADLGELSAEERSILKAGVQSAKEFRAQNTGTTTAGGFTVPTELENVIIKTMKAWGPMYDDAICTVLNTAAGNPIKLPTVDDTAVTAVKHTEGVALTDDGSKDATFGQKSLDAFVYDTEFVRFSMELAQDSIFNMESLLGELLGERLARIANLQLTTGDGSGDPNGIVTASSLGKTAAAAAAIASDEIIDLLHSVNSAYRRSPKARFMFADTTLAAVRKLKDGQGNYLWQMGDVTTAQPGTLLGYQYSINDDMDSLAAAKKVMLFGDFSKYFVRKVGSPVIGVLRERFWPDLGIAGLIRFDGELGDTAAVKHLITAAS